MKKNIKDYLHLYLNSGLSGVAKMKGHDLDHYISLTGWNIYANEDEIEWIKPILRPLSDMTEEEANIVWKLFGWNERITNFQERMMNILWEFDPPDEESEPDWSPGRWKYLISALLYLLKQGFDLFNLIPEGLSIDKNKPSNI